MITINLRINNSQFNIISQQLLRIFVPKMYVFKILRLNFKHVTNRYK